MMLLEGVGGVGVGVGVCGRGCGRGFVAAGVHHPRKVRHGATVPDSIELLVKEQNDKRVGQ